MNRNTVPFTDAPFSLHRYLGFAKSKSVARQPLIAMSLRDLTDDSQLPTTSDDAAVAKTLTGAIKVRLVPVCRTARALFHD